MTKSPRQGRPGYGGAVPRRRTGFADTARRAAYGANLAVFLLALMTIAVVASYFAHRPELRWRFDATKTRAYSLSPQTTNLLDDIEGAWTIAIVAAEDQTDAATRQQVDEVLRRYREASDSVSVARIDPTDPATLDAYEELITRLRMLEKDEIDAYDRALDAGAAAFGDLLIFSQQQSGQLDRILPRLDTADAARRDVQQCLGLLGLLGSDGGQVLEAVDEARRIGDVRPIPDYETARSILAQGLSQWADELYAMSGFHDRWREQESSSPLLARYAASVHDAYVALAQRLAAAADPLARLPGLQASAIGHQLERGEAALVIGPDGAAVIASEQLFPKLNLRGVGEGMVAFDRRFRGEQVISAAFRSLLVDALPMVVFAHVDEQPALRENPQHTDVLGVASLLKTSRLDVREWRVGRSPKPVPEADQPVVWVILPPTQRAGLEPGEDERALIAAAKGLIADGDAVLLNVYPSLLPRYRQPDPWASIAAPFGLAPDTSVALFEAQTLGDGTMGIIADQSITAFPDPHVVCAAVNGQLTSLVLPVPIDVVEGAAADAVRHDVIAAVEPGGRRWLEKDWARALTGGDLEPGAAIEKRQTIVMAAERDNPVASGRQRFVLVGSGGWLQSRVADSVTAAGARAALNAPGNQELALALVTWLAGFDEMIAPSPVSRQVERLDGIDAVAQVRWGLITVIGTPLGCLLVGMFVWMGRRLTS